MHLGGSNTAAEANELALSAALLHYSQDHGVEVGKLSVLSFDNAHHGNTTATLSCSSPAVNTHNLPAFPWPKAEWPQLKFPFAQHEHQNRKEEDRCLDGVRHHIERQKTSGNPVGALIVEPISSVGNQIATPYFFKKLRDIAHEEGIPFIVDETKTGMGATGKNWGHEQWFLAADKTPDFVTFGGKSGLSGFYSTFEHRLNDECTSFQQQVDMIKLLSYGHTWRIIDYDNLLHLQKDTSSFLKIELERVGRETDGLVSNVRGSGTYLGFDCQNPFVANKL